MKKLRTSLVLIILCYAAPLMAQTVTLFEQDELLEITFTTDLTTLLADVGDEREEHPAVIAYQDGGETIQVPLKVKTRGNFRRNPENCNFPPLRLNFAKKTSVATLFEGLDKFKLVSHCQNDKPAYEQYIVQEYLLYRVYNQLTDASFKARLVQIRYVDSEDNQAPITRLAFLIEDEELLASRHNSEVFDPEDLKIRRVDDRQTTLLHLFEYMIGNVDWSVPIHHNMKLMGPKPNAKLIPVPYDFDHAGVIDTEYADDVPYIGTASLRYQLFREFCRSQKELRPFYEIFNERRDAIYALYEHTPVLDDEQRRKALRYYDRFYRVINDEIEAEKTFIKPCMGSF